MILAPDRWRRCELSHCLLRLAGPFTRPCVSPASASQGESEQLERPHKDVRAGPQRGRMPERCGEPDSPPDSWPKRLRIRCHVRVGK